MDWMELIAACARPATSGLADYGVSHAIEQIKEVYSLPSIWPNRYYVIAGGHHEVERLRRLYNLLPMEMVYVTHKEQLLGLASDTHVILTENFQRSPVFSQFTQLNHTNLCEGMMFLMSRFSWKTGHLCRFVEPQDPGALGALTIEKLQKIREGLQYHSPC